MINAQTKFELEGTWLITDKNICVNLIKSGNDYLVKGCEDKEAQNKYNHIAKNKYKKDEFEFVATSESQIIFINGSKEVWTRQSQIKPVRRAPPILSIEEITLSKNRLQGGETIQLSVKVKNSGEGDATDAQLNLYSVTKEIEFISPTKFKNIKKSGGVEILTVDINGGLLLKAGEAELKLEVTELTHKIKIIGQSVKIKTDEYVKPELLLAKFAVLENLSPNPNNRIDLNEQIDVLFIVQNVGAGRAENIQIKVDNNQKGVVLLGAIDEEGKLIRTDKRISELNSGKHQTVAYRYFINSELQSSKLSFSITAKEKHGKFGFSQAKTVDINSKLTEEGYIRTLENVQPNLVKKSEKEKLPDLVSDVDVEIPITGKSNEKTFALIIGNEKYLNETQVEFALNDALIFNSYLEKTMGIPAKNIRLLKNATYGQMLDGIKWLSDVAKAFDQDAKFIVYYAGHGLPDEQSKQSFILPTDGNAENILTAINLSDYLNSIQKATEQPIFVFIDACFSGNARSEGADMLVQARGVKIKPKGLAVFGKTVLFSASTGDETAFPFSEKKHGMFTYFLLKKIKESKGEFRIGELSDYIQTNVSQQSILINKKSQSPQTLVGKDIIDNWKDMGL
ncbi:MAG: caspase family protein [Sphingobacteriaceae bacterium]|nr:caspase family protein [Sphingobacteriaceae bacterium]